MATSVTFAQNRASFDFIWPWIVDSMGRYPWWGLTFSNFLKKRWKGIIWSLAPCNWCIRLPTCTWWGKTKRKPHTSFQIYKPSHAPLSLILSFSKNDLSCPTRASNIVISGFSEFVWWNYIDPCPKRKTQLLDGWFAVLSWTRPWLMMHVRDF